MKQISLSDNEWKLMGRLWERSPRTITELTADLTEEDLAELSAILEKGGEKP